MPDRTAPQQSTVTTLIDIAAQMAIQTQRIARRDVVEVGEVELTDEERAMLSDALVLSSRRWETSVSCGALADHYCGNRALSRG